MKCKRGVCLTCGGSGFAEAFVYCNKCTSYVVHRYCLPIFTLRGNVFWLCEDCEPKIPTFSSLREIVGERLRDEGQDLQRHKGLEDNINAEAVESLGSRHSESVQLKLEVPRVNYHENTDKGSKQGTQTSKGWADEAVESLYTADSEVDVGLEMHTVSTDEPCKVVNEVAEACKKENANFSGLEEASFQETAECHETKSHDMPNLEIQALDRDCCKSNRKCQQHEEKNVPVGIFSNEAIASSTAESLRSGSQNHTVERVDLAAQPIKDPIWWGSMRISSENSVTCCELAAHLSSLACSKVCDATKSLPRLLAPDLLPRTILWPKGFMRWGPSNDSIGLYFFPNDGRSVKILDGLVQNMILSDLAMRVATETAELLIFTSTMLPMEYWSFQGKFYLWGVFRTKQRKGATFNVAAAKGQQAYNGVTNGAVSPVSTLCKQPYSYTLE